MTAADQSRYHDLVHLPAGWTTTRVAWGVAAMLAVVALPAEAWAHPILDRARQRYYEADFAGALEQLARAERADDLTRTDALALLGLRALVHLGMENQQAFESDLARLVAIDPSHRFGDEAPPEAAEALDRARSSSPGPLAVRVVVDPQASGVSLAPDLQNDVGSMVREVRVHGRAAGETRFERATDGVLVIQGDASGAVEYYAEAVGPGGAIIATAGSESSPLRWAPRDGSAVAPDPGEGGGPGAWVWILGGVGVVAVAAVVVLVATSSSGDPSTQPSLPMPAPASAAP